MGPVRQNPIQRTVSLFICVCIALCTVVAHNIAQNRPDSFPPYPPDNHHSSDDVYLREEGDYATGHVMWSRPMAFTKPQDKHLKSKKSSPLLAAMELRILSLSVDKMSSALDSIKAFSLSRGMFLTLCPRDAVSPSTFFLPSTFISLCETFATTWTTQTSDHKWHNGNWEVKTLQNREQHFFSWCLCTQLFSQRHISTVV